MASIKNKTFQVQIRTDALLAITVNAPSLEEALLKAKESLKDISLLYSEDVEVIDRDDQVTGIYE